MALRSASALLGTFTYSGVLCIAAQGRTCIAHGLPETPDAFSFTPLGLTANASLYPQSAHVESWNATSIVIVNSINFVLASHFTAKVAWSPTL